jgi:hypothetical protein
MTEVTVEEYLKFEYGEEKWYNLSEKTREQIPICRERCPHLLDGLQIKPYGNGSWTKKKFEDYVQTCYENIENK